MIILSFWTKFTPQKRYFQSKTEQAVQGLQAFAFSVVNVNSTALFFLTLCNAFQTPLCFK